MKLSIKALISKLNKKSTTALENAIRFCAKERMPSVEVEHWLLGFLQDKQSDFYKLLDKNNIDLLEFLEALQASFADLSGKLTTQTPSFSQSLTTLFQDAWMVASVEYESKEISSGHILLTLVKNIESCGLNFNLRNILRSIDLAKIHEEFKSLYNQQDKDQKLSNVLDASSALAKFSTDITQQAKNGKLDRAIGRTSEINQIIDILCRRKQNNPIIVGEAGVGKTAVVEELAINIINKNVPEVLQGTSLKILDLAALSAGASVKGEFEERLKQVIKEVKTSPTPIILFIDEIHNMLGSGSGSVGQNDAANLLKPELAKGELKIIGATTWAEYKKFFEKDAALNRRFQLIKINEPSEQEAIAIVRNIANLLEKHHNVQILDNAIQACVKLSIRYMSHLRLPDKAITLLDSACSKVRLLHDSTPLSLSEIMEQIKLDKMELERYRKNFMDESASIKIPILEASIQEKEENYEKQKQIWQNKVEIAKKMKTLGPNEIEEYKKQQEALNNPKSELVIHPYVNDEVIADILSSWTNIPISTNNNEEEVANLLSLEDKITQRVIGQDHAVSKIVETIRISKAHIGNERKPIGVFFLVGESGVGKTETALSIAETVYGHESKIITINMSEYKEAHKISTLIGSPPGYVGYGEGGRLTEAVRKNPYSVILLDEVEKAHPDIQDLFLQVFDKGTLVDSEGVAIDFKNTVIIMTSNAGAKKINEFCKEKLQQEQNNQTQQDSEEQQLSKTNSTEDNEDINLVYKNKVEEISDNNINEQEQSISKNSIEQEKDNETIQDTNKENQENKSNEKQEDLHYIHDEDLLLLKETIDAELLKYFKPEFLGRVVTIPYISLSPKILKTIVHIQLNKINKKLQNFYNAQFIYDDSAVNFIVDYCQNSHIGARKIEQIVQTDIMPDLSLALLEMQAKKLSFSKVSLKYQDDAFTLAISGVKENK